MIKTPVTVLQELMTKYLEVPSYECIAQTGPQHLSVFEYRCVAHGVKAHGVARSKKEAKQEAARRTLAALAAVGIAVPPPYHIAPDSPPPTTVTNESALPLPSSSHDSEDTEVGGAGRVDSRSYVSLLKELCEEFRLGAVTYDLVGDTGPPHLRKFTVRAALASHERMATATTKKAARQMAAEQLYMYLRHNLASSTKDFVERTRENLLKGQTESEKGTGNVTANEEPRKRKSTDEVSEEVRSKRCCAGKTLDDNTIVKRSEEALSRALDKVMSRYVEIREEQPWRPDLGQRIADYHLDDEQRLAAVEAASADNEDTAAVLQQTATAMGLTVELTSLPGEQGTVSVVSLGPTGPALTMAGRDPSAAARAALRYLRRSLRQRPDLTTTNF